MRATLKSWLRDFLSSCLRQLKISKIWRRALVVASPPQPTFDRTTLDRSDTWSERHLIKKTFDRNNTRSKRQLIETTFDRIMKEKIYNFESVSILSIFCPKNLVVSKKDLHFETVPILLIFCPKNIIISKKNPLNPSVISAKYLQRWHHGIMPSPKQLTTT